LIDIIFFFSLFSYAIIADAAFDMLFRHIFMPFSSFSSLMFRRHTITLILIISLDID